MRGVLLLVAGVWVLTQVLAGNALGRLGVTGAATTPGQTTAAPASSRAAAALPASAPTGFGG